MGVALQTIGLGVQASDTTSITITAPTDITDGDLLLAMISRDGPTALISGTGFTVPTVANGVSQTGDLGTILYKIASSESGDYTFTWSGNQTASGAILRIDGQSADNFLDEFAFAYTTGAFPTAVPAFVRYPGSLYVGCMFTDGSETGSIISPLTERVDQSSGGSGQCHLYVATGSPPASSVGHYYPYAATGEAYRYPYYQVSGSQYRTIAGMMILPARTPGVNFGIVHPGMSGGMNG